MLCGMAESPLTRYAVGLLAVLAVTGCGGSQDSSSFSAADANRIGSVRPQTPNWAWPKRTVSAGPCTPDDEPREDPTDELQATLDQELIEADLICIAGSKWKDDDKLGALAAMRFESAAGAHKGLAAFRVFAHGWGERSGEVLGDEEIDGLGDEATRLRVGGNGVQVTYFWHRGNLVLQAHIHCFGVCPPDVDALTRVWVDAIDEEARTGG